MRLRPRVLVFLAFVCVFFSGCGAEEFFYLVEQAPGQFSLLIKREGIEKILKRPDLDAATREKLELVLDIKSYAENDIGLVRNPSYTIYTELNRDAVVYNLTACPALSLEPLRWDFPVVGQVPYLGFFKKSDGIKKMSRLESQGHDVYLRPCGAYSMLGIVSDPLYSPLLRLREADLANLIIHELVHATVWVEGEVEFNENIALFIGDRGSYEYCVSRWGEESPQAVYAKASKSDDRIFSEWMDGLFLELESLYNSEGITEPDMLSMKRDIIERHRIRYNEQVLPSMSSGSYRDFEEGVLDNAYIASRRVYFSDQTLYEEIFEKCGSDLSRMVEFFRDVDARGVKPEPYCREWVSTH